MTMPKDVQAEPAWRVILVENEPRRVLEFLDALTTLDDGRMRPHVAGDPDQELGERITPCAVLVASAEAVAEADDLCDDHPAIAPLLVRSPAAHASADALFARLDELVDEACADDVGDGEPGARVLVLWDDQLDTPWALAENANGMTLQFAARWGESLERRGLRSRVRLIGISAQQRWTSAQVEDYARFLRRGDVDDFKDRAHVDRLVAEQTASAGGERVAYVARVGGELRRGAAGPRALARIRREMEDAARARLVAVAARLARGEDAAVAGSWNPAFAGPLVIDETAGVLEILEHADRPAWAAEHGWDAADPETGKRRLATHVLKEITERHLAALRDGGAAAADAWEWRRLSPVGAGLDFGSVAYRLFRHIVERGDVVERHEIVRAGLAQDSAVNTYASRIRSGVARHELIESVTSGGYRCTRDYLMLNR